MTGKENSRNAFVPLTLCVTGGPCAGETIAKTTKKFMVGRTKTTAICLKDGEVSQRHAELLWSADGGWSVTDKGSSNGTKVNGETITEGGVRTGRASSEPCLIKHGDVILFGGSSECRVDIAVDGEAAAVGTAVKASRPPRGAAKAAPKPPGLPKAPAPKPTKAALAKLAKEVKAEEAAAIMEEEEEEPTTTASVAVEEEQDAMAVDEATTVEQYLSMECDKMAAQITQRVEGLIQGLQDEFTTIKADLRVMA